MSGATESLQAALVALLLAAPDLAGLTGIYDTPPTRAAFPYLSIGSSLSSDWGTKTETGRELRVALTLWDDGLQPTRLYALMAALERAVMGLPRTLPGWRVVSLVFIRSLIARDPQGPWAGLVEHRVRLLQL